MDDGVVAILCLSRNIRQAVNEKMRALPKENVMESVKNNATIHVKLPMPDSRCLDARILKLVNLIENTNQKKSLACHDSPGSKKPKRLRHYLGVPECEKTYDEHLLARILQLGIAIFSTARQATFSVPPLKIWLSFLRHMSLKNTNGEYEFPLF